MKRCWGCGRDLPGEAYWKDRGKRDGLQSKCKECQYARYKERLATDPESVRRIARESQARTRLRRLYGITHDEFEAMSLAQGGRCAICQQIPPPKQGTYGGLVVDHGHETGRVRGLLCHPCNRGLGLLRDDISVLEAAIRYLGYRYPSPSPVPTP